MSQPELLARLVATLAEVGIDYMIVGSVASSLQGEPRSTHDIDVVVVMTPSGAAKLAEAFPPPDYYLDPVSIQEAPKTGGMFNLLDILSGDKVDFWLLKDEPYDHASFERRQLLNAAGTQLYVQRPEDTILSKLRWAQMSGGSEKQFRDALRVYEVQLGTLDLAYLDRWAAYLGIENELAKLKGEAETEDLP